MARGDPDETETRALRALPRRRLPRIAVVLAPGKAVPQRLPADHELVRALDAVTPPFEIRGLRHSGLTRDELIAMTSTNRIFLIREPNNGHDPNAIAAHARGGRVGYLGASLAAAIAPMIDAGDYMLVADDLYLAPETAAYPLGRLWMSRINVYTRAD